MFFDVQAAQLLQPGQHLLVQGCNGLRLVASASRRSWTYRYKDAAGRMRQVGLGVWPSLSVQEAVAKWNDCVQQRNAGADPAQDKRQAKAAARVAGEPVTVAAVVHAYIDGPLRQGRAPAGFEAARRSLLRTLEDGGFASARAEELTRSAAFAVIDARKGAPTAAAKLRSLLGAAWEHAQDSGLIAEAPNWWRDVLRGKLRSKGKLVGGVHVGRQRRVLSAAETGQLLAWLPNMHEVGRDAVTMYLWTGTRGAEILAARSEHLRQEEGQWWWIVPKALTKNARFDDAVDLRVPLFGRALEIMLRRMEVTEETPEHKGWLFAGKGGRAYTQHALSTYIYDLQPYSKKSQARPQRLVLPVVDWSPHHLRKTTRTMLAQLGCPNDIGEAIMGHMPPDIVGTYNAYSYDRERYYWLSKLSDFLDLLAGEPVRP